MDFKKNHVILCYVTLNNLKKKKNVQCSRSMAVNNCFDALFSVDNGELHNIYKGK